MAAQQSHRENRDYVSPLGRRTLQPDAEESQSSDAYT